MIIRTVDGAAFYAKYLLRAEIEDEAAPFRIEDKKGAYCFDDDDLARAEAYLKGQGIKYEIEKLPAPANWARTVGVKYSSLEEVRAHLEQGTEPESTLVPRLLERLAVAEAKAARVDALEDRLQSLERAAKQAEK